MTKFDKGFDAFEKKDYTTAFAEWASLAKQGFRWAKHNVAVMHFSGWGVEVNMPLAKKLFDELKGQVGAEYTYVSLDIIDPRKK